MDPWGSGAARLWRAALLSGAVVALAAAAHTWGQGAVPPLAALALLGALTLPVTVLLTCHQVSGAAVLAVLGAGQLVMHGAFTAITACGAASGLTVGGPVGHAGHGALDPASAATCAHATHATGSGLSMVVLHAVATLLTAALVTGADRSLWRLLDKVVPRVGGLVALPSWPPTSRPTISACVSPSLHLRVLPARRGPPARGLARLSLAS